MGQRARRVDKKTRIAVVGTDLARLEPGSGALERAVIAWSEGLSANGHEVSLLDAGPDGPSPDELERLSPDVVILNNRPAWASRVGTHRAVLHILHNYDDAWSSEPLDPACHRLALARENSAVVCVSAALARHVADAFSPARTLGTVAVPVEPCFLSASWRGQGGPVLFPNRLLEKKGVRFFLELAALLSRRGLSCRLFRHTAPFFEPTPEQQHLIALADSSPHVQLLDPPGRREEMAEAYATAGVVLCPSIRPEGLGLVALEAQAVGTPLLTSGLGGLEEITFAPNEVVPGFDPPAWAAAVERALGRGPAAGPPRQVADGHGHERAVSSLVRAVGELTRDGLPGRSYRTGRRVYMGRGDD